MVALQEWISPMLPGQPSGGRAKGPHTRCPSSEAGSSSVLTSSGLRDLWARADLTQQGQEGRHPSRQPHQHQGLVVLT